MDCPYCQSHKVVKNGHRQGKQSYLCRECGRQFRENPCPGGYSSDVKELCVKMSLNGMGFRAIERVTGISHNTILNWVRVAETHIDEENYEIPEIAQIDEPQTFVGSKKNHLGLDSCEYQTAWNSEVCHRRQLIADFYHIMANDSGLGWFSIYYGPIQSLSLLN
ncbi:transposase, DNA binding subunit InsA, IS1 family [Limnospira indica PCC 8005]|uniref:Transposase, DNA binding subunit InsA, IS1 family n=1 Tax=Limnospira indica PCC 8005 TaxID=376219 RepID=A0A9P1KD23_9CYAN|nr:transposase, DNA binding subunit InsA, IS1 family [Limnospira indica PCC 8005]